MATASTSAGTGLSKSDIASAGALATAGMTLFATGITTYGSNTTLGLLQIGLAVLCLSVSFAVLAVNSLPQTTQVKQVEAGLVDILSILHQFPDDPLFHIP